MSKKQILFIFSGELFKLPPFMTILESLCDEFYIKVMCHETSENLSKLKNIFSKEGIIFENIITRKPLVRDLPTRIKGRVARTLNLESEFHKSIKRRLATEKYDILWIIHENTLAEVMDLLPQNGYIFSMYELNDARQQFLDKISSGIRNASKVIVCEPNRAYMLRVWLNLAVTPTVIPNKPLNHPRNKFSADVSNDFRENKKIILYQGHIQPNRNVEPFCKAVEDLEGFQLVLMGAHTDYRDELQRKYPKIKVIDFVNPPHHLDYTSHAYLGIVKYDYVDLNSIYCAPNKTFEYAGFGIPMIANDIPGLIESIGAYSAAECVNTDDVNQIKDAILKIDANYERYSQNATTFYDSINIKSEIRKILHGQ